MKHWKKRGDDDDAESGDLDRRRFKVEKVNYARRGEVVNLRWDNGVFVPESAPSTTQRAATEASIDDAFLRCLDAATACGRTVSDSTGRNYAPAMFEKMPEAAGFNKRALALAMERLFSTRRIRSETEGKGRHAKKHLQRPQ